MTQGAMKILEEVTVKLHPSVYRLGVGSVLAFLSIAATMFVWGFDQREEDIRMAEEKFTTKVQHDADIERLEQVHTTQINSINGKLERIELTQDKILDKLSE